MKTFHILRRGEKRTKETSQRTRTPNSVQTQNYHKNIHFRTVRTQNYKKNTYFEIHNKGIQSKTRTLILFEPKTTTKIHILEQGEYITPRNPVK